MSNRCCATSPSVNCGATFPWRGRIVCKDGRSVVEQEQIERQPPG
ncbi:hypothetical protein C8J41_102927 [Sphingomonas sp. PP-CC-3G-468]|nr:hypothetical protein C8J41_102927 [Sphingomonas sp. PP-CC-3G-468]